MQKLYDAPAENRAYMEGFVKARQADGLDWAKAAVELVALREKVKAQIAGKDYEIYQLKLRMQKQREAYEEKITDLESQLEAWKLAWKHRGDPD